jgi:hypothetical protein
MSNKKDHKKFVSRNKNKSQVAKPLHEWCVKCTLSILSFYLWSWLVSLFCLSHSDLPNQDTACHVALGAIGKLPQLVSIGAPSEFHNVLTYGGKVIEY